MEGAKDFNPRSREGSDNIPKLIYNCSSISIHAPARGATCGQNQPIAFFVISIHAPARGATAETQEILTFDIISIHAPARGATSFRDVTKPTSQNFNPRSREGSDRKYTQTTNIISVYFYLYYIIFVSLATNTAYITITKPSKCRCESPYTFC